jgi:flagellar hook assembly protein FlgD
LGGVQLSSSVIEPTQGAPVPGQTNSVTLTLPNGATVAWDGKNDAGQIVTDGSYQLEVVLTDGKGGQEVVTQSVVVEDRNNSVTQGIPYAMPSVLKGGATSTIIQVNSTMNLTLTVSLYDTAGEKVKAPVTGGVGTRQAPLDVGGLASGLYLVVVDIYDTNGHFLQKQITKIVIQR